MPIAMSTPGLLPSWLVDAFYPPPALPTQPPPMGMPQVPRPSPKVPVPPTWKTAVPNPPDFRELPSGFDPNVMAPGSIHYGGPKLNSADALAGLRNASPSPLLDIQRIASSMSPGGGAYRGGIDIEASKPFHTFVSESLAPQRLQTNMAEQALGAQHPAIRSLAATTAQQKALPAMATASGMTGAADISAEAAIQKAMIEALQGQREEAAGAMTPIWNFLGDIIPPGTDFESLSPEVQQLIQRAVGALGQYHTAAGF